MPRSDTACATAQQTTVIRICRSRSTSIPSAGHATGRCARARARASSRPRGGTACWGTRRRAARRAPRVSPQLLRRVRHRPRRQPHRGGLSPHIGTRSRAFRRRPKGRPRACTGTIASSRREQSRALAAPGLSLFGRADTSGGRAGASDWAAVARFCYAVAAAWPQAWAYSVSGAMSASLGQTMVPASGSARSRPK